MAMLMIDGGTPYRGGVAMDDGDPAVPPRDRTKVFLSCYPNDAGKSQLSIVLDRNEALDLARMIKEQLE